MENTQQKHSIGPFTFDGSRVRMDVGIYTLRKPLEFEVCRGKTIEGVTYRPLFDSNANTAVGERTIPDAGAA